MQDAFTLPPIFNCKGEKDRESTCSSVLPSIILSPKATKQPGLGQVGTKSWEHNPGPLPG